MSNKKFISKEEQDLIVKAIERAELNTSGEIRVHIESECKLDPIARAVTVFNKLKMNKTKERNGVLIYIAWKSRKFAIIGDIGIDEKVPENFWDKEREILLNHLKEGKAAIGIAAAIEMAGENLKEHFSYQSDDVNEQSNEISFGE
ncbi:MAG: TPM domain-containing protein [Bacteroidales bacterium]|nr:TPM domain-containing protein [Bacteroidales bacterium]MDD4656761.1 TPM domain-containing protein [Bacteroidales bacterium]